MNQYDKNANRVLDFLKADGYGASAVSEHRVCYREFRKYLVSNGLPYSPEIAEHWLNCCKDDWTRDQLSSNKKCITHLNDIYVLNSIPREHLGQHRPCYDMLAKDNKIAISEFISSNPIYSRDCTFKASCSKFLLFLQINGASSIQALTYDLLLRFHEEDTHASYKSKDVYEDKIRAFLRYNFDEGNCTIGFSLALNKLLIPQIIKLDAVPASIASSDDILQFDTIASFISKLKSERYSHSVIKYSKHILTLLYIFLDMHRLGFSEEVIWYWFELVKPKLKSCWKQARRTLCQFLIFHKFGYIETAITGNPSKTLRIDNLPDNFKVPLKEYLTLLKREGLKPSSIDMQRSSNVRFCCYLNECGIKSFNEITPQILEGFNFQDQHKNAEAKVAYNSRIREFLIYLYEEKKIINPYLHRALPSASATTVPLVKILSEEDQCAIWDVDVDALTAVELRDYAIVCVGLTTGFRSSDIVSIRFGDIDWKKKCISIVQQKTGVAQTMPLSIRTGNILFRYISSARPSSSSEYVFINHNVPYDKMNRTVCARALKRFLPQGSDATGFHIARKTFATNLLRGDSKVELISDSLGHTTDFTVAKYLSLDVEKMLLCPLSMFEAGISPKGEWFHD